MPDRTTRPRILIVDDSQATRDLIYWSLGGASAPYEVSVAEDAAEALDVLTSGDFRVVIVDHHLPDARGVTLIERIRREDPAAATRILYLAPDADPASAQAARAAGAHGVVLRSFTPRELQDAVSALVSPERPAVPLTIQSLLDGFPYLAMVLDEDHRLVVSNEAFYQTTGTGVVTCPADCSAAVHGDAGEPGNCPLRESVATGAPARRIVEDEHAGRLDVGVYPLVARSDDGKRLFLHLAAPANG